MIDLDGCDNSMTNIILATIRDADEQCNDFRNKRLDLVGESLGRELWANIHLQNTMDVDSRQALTTKATIK